MQQSGCFQRRWSRVLLVGAAFAVAVCAAPAAQPLERLDGCQFVPTNWADGDSFLVETADGIRRTIRIYGADCIETRVTDETDARRLREQRRYFGISEAGGSPQASIDLARNFGRQAAEETFRALARPFTVHTAFTDARGDGNHQRIYAFVVTSDGEDLGERLVRLGLARAFGVCRETPAGISADAYRETLRDIELRAARFGSGVWAHTDWEKLQGERKLERDETEELKLATSAGKAPPDRPLDANTAARDELMRVPGVGEVTATRIIQGRPYATVDELMRVNGIGPKTFETMREYLTIGE